SSVPAPISSAAGGLASRPGATLATAAPCRWTATVQLGNVGLGGSFAGADVTASDAPTVNTTVGSGKTVEITGSLLVKSLTQQYAYVNGLTYSVGGIVGIGVINPTATTGGMISTGFDGTVTKAETVTVSAVDTVRTNATAPGGTGWCAVGIHDFTATATTGPKITTSVGGTITAHMDVVVESVVFTDTQAISTGVVFAGVAAVSKLSVVATDETKISTDVTGPRPSPAGNIRISAYHDYDAKATPKPKLLDTFQTVASIENTNISLFVQVDHGAKISADA